MNLQDLKKQNDELMNYKKELEQTIKEIEKLIIYYINSESNDDILKPTIDNINNSYFEYHEERLKKIDEFITTCKINKYIDLK